MPSHADTIATALRERVAGIALTVGNAGRGFTRAAQGASQASDVEAVMQAGVAAVIAAEALHAAADASVRLLREALAEAIEASGSPSVKTEHHSAYLSRKQPFLSITDESKIPRDFYVQPPVALDKRALKSAITDGIAVDGVSLVTPNSMSLVIRAREAKS
jgi:hypothetical protein